MVMSQCRARIQELGFKPEKVAELVSRTFNEMVFIHGDVHCDPHAANLFLRKNPANGQMQLVLLDHGLYRYTPLYIWERRNEAQKSQNTLCLLV